MSCEVAVVPFKAHTNYGTWSIDFDFTYNIYSNLDIALLSTSNLKSNKEKKQNIANNFYTSNNYFISCNMLN